MDNYLNNGAVLPSGLLGNNQQAMMAGFNKTYKNSSLRIGVVVASYPTTDSNNHSKLTTEYDVQVIEQNEDQSVTSIRYKNCMSAEGMGSIADFFEKSLRTQKSKKNKGATTLNDQDGAIVLILCLDAMSDKAIVVGSLTHPNRATTLKSSEPYLEGEYNGVNIVVNNDGSTTLTFKGATDNNGDPIDSSQGNTEIKIESDGSYQVDHDSITFRLDRRGTASLTAKKDVNVTAQGNISFQIQGDATLDVKGKVSVTSGADTTVNAGGECKVTSSGKTTVNASEINLNGSSGRVLTTTTEPFTDLITGFPTNGVPTVKAG